jgi:predicted N-acetyltransferase YhbS
VSITRHKGEDVRIEVGRFYEAVGYAGGVRDVDVVFVERRGDDVVGAVRLCREEGVLVLRGMYVSGDLRGTGIGTRMLEAVSGEIGDRECWCVPFNGLSDFYSRAGFSEYTSGDAPAFLLERLKRYKAGGMDVILMKRQRSTRDSG